MTSVINEPAAHEGGLVIILLSVTTARLLRGFGVSSEARAPVSARGPPLTLSEAVVSASS